jgi:hypothetical protein
MSPDGTILSLTCLAIEAGLSGPDRNRVAGLWDRWKNPETESL